MRPKSDIDHWKIPADVYDDRVEETHFVTDVRKNIKRQERKVVWHRERVLGRGGFGEVRLETNRNENKFRAVKKIAAGAALSHSECEEELRALLEFSKPKHGFDFCIAMEYIEQGDLNDKIREIREHSEKVSEVDAQDITQQILKGLEIMHAESFAHRDLKRQNVMVVDGPPQSRRWWVKLADFGLSKRLTDTSRYHTRSGTPFFMAPEVRGYLDTGTASRGYTNAIDLWAVGCITYWLVTGDVPLPSDIGLINFCKDKSLFPSQAILDSRVGEACINFTEALLTASPKGRPSTTQALANIWITSDLAAGAPKENNPYARLEGSWPSGPPVSTMDYATKTHDGLKSAPHGNAPKATSSGRVRSTANTEPSNPEAATHDTPEPEIPDRLDKRALRLTGRGKYGEAELVYRQALEQRTRALGADHANTLGSMLNLADVFAAQNKYKKAEEIFRQVLQRCMNTLGPDDPGTLKSMHGLASVLRHEEKYNDAESMYRQVLERHTRVFGPDDPDTLNSMHGLASVRKHQEKYSEIESMYRQALGHNTKQIN